MRKGIVIFVFLMGCHSPAGAWDISAMWNLGTVAMDIVPTEQDSLFEWDVSVFNLTLYDNQGSWGFSTSFLRMRSDYGDIYYTLLPLEVSYSFLSDKRIRNFLIDARLKRPLQAFALFELDVGPKVLPYLRVGVRGLAQFMIDYSYAPKIGLDLSFDTMLRFRISLYADLGAVVYLFARREQRNRPDLPPDYVF